MGTRSAMAMFFGGFFFILRAEAALNFEILVPGNKSSDKPVEKILVTVPEAQVQISSLPAATGQGPQKVKIQLNDAAAQIYQVFHEADTVIIRMKESSEEAANTQKKMIEIQAPPLSLEVHVFNGEINLSQWNSFALLHLQKGKTSVKDCKADVQIHNQHGEILVENHQGRVEVDSFKAGSLIRNLQGDLRLENFMGESVVDKAKGTLQISQGQGTVKVTGSQGALQFDQAKGIMNVVQFSGRVEGVTQEGPVNVNMATDTEVSLRSQSGKVTVHSPSGGGVYLNLATQEGEIYAPNYLKIYREGLQKSLKARMRGDAQKSSIFIRTQEGGIFIR